MAKKAIIAAKKEVGNLHFKNSHKKVYKLAKDSDKSLQEIADCIHKTYRMLHLALTTDKYPFIQKEVLECLGYKVKVVQYLETSIPESKEDD